MEQVWIILLDGKNFEKHYHNLTTTIINLFDLTAVKT